MNLRSIIIAGMLAALLLPAAAMADDLEGWDIEYDDWYLDYAGWSDDFDDWYSYSDDSELDDGWESDYDAEVADGGWDSDYDAEAADDGWYEDEWYEDDWYEDSDGWESDDAFESTNEDGWESDDAFESTNEDGWESESLNEEDGTYWYGDRLETWFSSEAAYHYMTPEWWVDEEGFYRNDDGYYVIAASDYEYGSVIEGSKGMCIVLDDGCDEGVSDYYVAW